MGVLSPSGLETCDIGTSGWNSVYSTDFEKINTNLGILMSSSKVPGVPTVTDPAAQTSETLIDSTGGTPSNTISAISGSGADVDINDAMSSLIDEINKLRADVLVLRNNNIALLAELRANTGVGILGG